MSQVPQQTGVMPSSHAAEEQPWWRGAVIYQIYPRSFNDSNGDGIGDLRGITEKLDHVAALGVDGIWLSPFFTSPMDDFGYDISDYCSVDPIFGTLDDFDALIERAHELGLKVTIDQVYSHSSDQHPWFDESRQSRDNDKADWYVWADPNPDGTPPNNWLSVFGGSAWQWDGRRRQYYLHNFLASQPDLNVHNEEVQAAMLDVARFWLDRGVDGFRLDALNFCMHDQALRSNPPADNFKWAPTRPYDFQKHLYNQSHANVVEFVERIRAVTDEYPGCFTVAEVGGPFPLKEMKAFTQGNSRLNSAYSFEFLYAEQLTAELIRSALRDWPGDEDEGWPSWAFSNHDAPRAISRWCPDDDTSRYARLLALVLFSLRGNTFVYQGEELGLPQAHVPFEALRDPEAIANWPTTFGRDGARTPIPWDATQHNAGFSSAAPWLPIEKEHLPLSVASHNAVDQSVLSFYRDCIALRKRSDALRLGSLTVEAQCDADLLILERVTAGDRRTLVANLTTQAVSLPERYRSFATVDIQVGDYRNGASELAPLSGIIGTPSG